MDQVPANVTYILAIVFLVFRELVNVLNNYSYFSYIKINDLFGVPKHIFCMKTVYSDYSIH